MHHVPNVLMRIWRPPFDRPYKTMSRLGIKGLGCQRLALATDNTIPLPVSIDNKESLLVTTDTKESLRVATDDKESLLVTTDSKESMLVTTDSKESLLGISMVFRDLL